MKIKGFLISLLVILSLVIGVNIWATTYIDDNHVTADKITTTTTGILTGTNGTIGVTAIPLTVANGGTNSTTAGTYLDATSSIQDQLDGKQPTISVLAVVNGGTGSTTSGTYLDATSAIQAQIDSKSASTHTQETSRGGTAIDLSSSTGILNVNSGTVAVVTPATSGDLNAIAGIRSQTQKKYLEINSDGLVKATSESSATFKLMGAVETVATGGTGVSSLGANGVVVSGVTTTSNLSAISGTDGQLLVMSAGSPTFTSSLSIDTIAVDNISKITYGGSNINQIDIVTSGTLGGKLTVTVTSDTTYTATSAVCSGGIIHMTAGGTINLPIASVGMSVTTKSTTTTLANAVIHIDPNGSEQIVLDGTILSAGRSVNSPGSSAGEYLELYCAELLKWETKGNPKNFVDNGA